MELRASGVLNESDKAALKADWVSWKLIEMSEILASRGDA